MQRNSHVRNLLILPLLALIVAGPLLASGMWSLRQAESATDPARAADLYETAAIRLFWRDDLWERAGISAQQAGQSGRAMSLLERAPSLSAQGWLSLAQARLQSGLPEQALMAFQSSIQQYATPQAYAGIAEIQRQRGEIEAERAALENQLLLGPADAAAQYRLGLLLSLLDIDRSLTHFQAAAQLDAEYASVYETLHSTLTLAELDPTETGRLVTLGRGLGLANEWDLAKRAFELAVAAEAGNAEAWAWLGEARQHLGGYGLSDLDQALALDPNSVVVRGLRGLYWARSGNPRQALGEYQAAAALEPDNPAWQVSLGDTYARLGDLELAIATLQRATELAPNNAGYWQVLAAFCLETGVHIEDVGLPAAQKAVDLAPEDPRSLDILGWAQLSLGKYYTAEQILLAALALAPDYPSAHLHLALVYLQTGDRTAARAHLLRAAETDPNSLTGQQADMILKQYFP